MALAIDPTIQKRTIQKPGPLEIKTFLPRFQMGFNKMAAICSDFKWLGFRISDPTQNWDHLQADLSMTIQNPY